jgi:hypothetical protein
LAYAFRNKPNLEGDLLQQLFPVPIFSENDKDLHLAVIEHFCYASVSNQGKTIPVY